MCAQPSFIVALFVIRWEKEDDYCQHLLQRSSRFYYGILEFTDTAIYDYLMGMCGEGGRDVCGVCGGGEEGCVGGGGRRGVWGREVGGRRGCVWWVCVGEEGVCVGVCGEGGGGVCGGCWCTLPVTHYVISCEADLHLLTTLCCVP